MAWKTARGRTLIVGATGLVGRFVAESSLASGRTTYVMIRAPPSSAPKAQIIRALQEKGAVILYGSISDRDLMEKTLKELEIDVVISAVGGASILEQLTLVEAIKAVGTVKRFLPSEFGHDVDRADPVEPGLTMYNEKRRVRRAVELAGIPYTYICCNSIAAWPYHDNTHPCEVIPPLDRFQIYGDGSVQGAFTKHTRKSQLYSLWSHYFQQADLTWVGCSYFIRGRGSESNECTSSATPYFVAGIDIGKFTVKAADDVRTLNKNVHFRPPSNLHSINDLALIWERKIGITLPRVTVTEEDLLVAAAENCIPRSIVAALTHDIFIKGCQINFAIDGPHDVEATALYPDIPFRTVDECFGDFVADIQVQQPMIPNGHFPKFHHPTENGGIKTPNNINNHGLENPPPNDQQQIGKKENGIGDDGIGSANSMVEIPAITATCG
ncbi:leucoanthocyanidin [Asimina triloba]